MTNKLFTISIISLLFLGSAVLFKFGWKIDYFAAPTYQKIRPEFYLLIFLLFYKLKDITRKNFLIDFKLLFLFVFATIHLLIVGEKTGLAFIINSIFIPICISINLKNNIISNEKIRKIILCFFIVNCSLAIIERIIGYNFLDYYNGGELQEAIIDIDSMSTFRSTALRNHPLGNSLLTSIIMSFIIVTQYLSNKWKLFLFSIGFISLMCFNSRSSIIITGGVSFIYICYTSFFTKINTISSKNIIIVSILLIPIITYLFSIGLGGRLLEENNFQDTSIEARFLAFDAFSNLKFSQFLVGGISINELQKISGLVSIENYWLLYICRFGFIYTLLFTIYFGKTFNYFIKGDFKINRIYLLSIFIILTSTNNSIYAGDPAIALFILCASSMISKNNNSAIKC